MTGKTKVMLWGLGAMGSGMARTVLQKPGLEVVSAVARTPGKMGQDLGQLLDISPLGVKVTGDPEEALAKKPDVVLLCTFSFLHQVFSQIETILRHGANVITIAEEMAYPQAASRSLADRLDVLAKEHGKTVLGTGINPGFVLDTLIITLTGACQHVKRIYAKRVNDLSPFGPTVMKTQGVGTTPEEFEAGVSSGEIVGHVGFLQSLMLVGESLGLGIDEVQEEKTPIVSRVLRKTEHVTVLPGQVAGCRHTARAFREGKEIISLEHPQQVCPELEGVETGDYIKVEGDPPINMSIRPEIPGGTGTVAVAINMIPLVMKAPPGLLTMADLPVPRAIPNI